MATSKKGREAFLSTHDKGTKVPRKIEAALAAMKKEGADRWEYDSDFRTLTGLAVTDLGAYRDRFAKYLVSVPSAKGKGSSNARLIWCCSPELAKEYSKIPGALMYEKG